MGGNLNIRLKEKIINNKKIISIFLGIILFILYSKAMDKAFGTVCTLKLLTGYPCPSCGMTRSLIELMHFHLIESFKMHPLLILVLIGVALYFYNEYFNKKYSKVLIVYGIITLVIFVIVYIVRMVNNFPGEEPFVYYDNNILKLLKELIRDIK